MLKFFSTRFSYCYDNNRREIEDALSFEKRCEADRSEAMGEAVQALAKVKEDVSSSTRALRVEHGLPAEIFSVDSPESELVTDFSEIPSLEESLLVLMQEISSDKGRIISGRDVSIIRDRAILLTEQANHIRELVARIVELCRDDLDDSAEAKRVPLKI